jgi:hypothetical protein
VFFAYVGFIGDHFFSLVLILRIRAYLGVKGDQFFSDFGFFFGARFMYKLMYYICITCPILRKIECIEFVCNEFVLVLVQNDLIQNQKNEISMKIPEFKRSGIGIIAKFRRILSRFPIQGVKQS